MITAYQEENDLTITFNFVKKWNFKFIKKLNINVFFLTVLLSKQKYLNMHYS